MYLSTTAAAAAAAVKSPRQYHHLYIALFHPQSQTTQDGTGSESLMWALYSTNTQTSLTTVIRHPSDEQTRQPAKTTTQHHHHQHAPLVTCTTLRHPWDVDDLVAALYVGMYLDTTNHVNPCPRNTPEQRKTSIIIDTANNKFNPKSDGPAVILGACVDISTLLLLASNRHRHRHRHPTVEEHAHDAARPLPRGEYDLTWVMSVLDVMHELGILALPTSTRAVAEFAVHMAAKYDRYGQTPRVVHGMDWMGEGLLDLSWVAECVGQEWMGRAFVDLSFLPDVHEWAQDEDNVFYLVNHGCLPWIG